MDKPDYFVDVAGERVYQNQSKAYYDAYTKWRNDPENGYGYGFRHDMREHTYVDGEGYADEFAVTAEKETLNRCFRFLGIAMLIFFLFQLALYIIMRYCFGISNIGWVYYTQSASVKSTSDIQCLIYCGIKIISYIAVIAFCAFRLRLPAKVSMPAERFSPKLFLMGISVSIMFLVISKVFDYIYVRLATAVKLDVCSYSYMRPDSTSMQIMYYATVLVIIPVLAELVFHGYILQLFRQFGDYFSMFIAALMNACYYHDLSKILFVFFLSGIMGFITIKTGNIYAAMVARVGAAFVSQFFNEMLIRSGDYSILFWTLVISLVILIVSYVLITYLRDHMKRTSISNGDATEISISEKLKLMLNSNYLMLWMVLSMIATILTVRFI